MDNSFEIRIDTVSVEQIREHFETCKIPLSGIDILTYTQKLRNKATTVEAWVGDTLVGLCACYMNDFVAGIAYISHISVIPEYRRNGVGKFVIDSTISTALSKNLKCVQLEVRKDNEAAIAFYNILGFLKIEDRPSKYLMNLFIGVNFNDNQIDIGFDRKKSVDNGTI